MISGVADRALAVRIERHWAHDEVVFSRALDDSWGAVTFSLADGEVVLDGPGLFVNRALGLGIDTEVGDDELDELEARSMALGVPAQVEVTALTSPGLVELLRARDYVEVQRTVVMAMELSGAGTFRAPADGVVVEAVDDASLSVWMDTAAAAWGHATAERRSASDAFARAAHIVDRPGLLLARSITDRRPLGCATLKAREGLATLGGMSTLPKERRRGVQAALVHHRLDLAAELGCDLAATSAAEGSPSARNLQRLGFFRSHIKVGFERKR